MQNECNSGLLGYILNIFGLTLLIALIMICVNIYFRGIEPRLTLSIVTCFLIVFSFTMTNAILSSQKLADKIEPTFCTRIKTPNNIKTTSSPKD